MSERKLKAKTWMKGKFKQIEPHFINKIVYHKRTIFDGFNNRFRSFISIFIPKLTPQYPKPRVMLHVSNDGGTCLIRYDNPDALIKSLEEIIDTLQSEKWKDAWWRAENIHENLIDTGELTFEEEIVDVNEWKEEIINDVDVKINIE